MLAASAVGVQGSAPTQADAFTIAQVDGGPHYYGRFSHPLPDNPHFFPIMAWLRPAGQQSDIAAYVDFGLTGLVGMENPEGAQESRLRQAGLHVLIQADERTRFDGLGKETKGWMLGDEQDMELGPTACPSAVNAVKAGLPDDGRLRFNGYGKGVLEWETDDEAKCWLQQQDVTAADTYWFTDPGKRAQRFGYLYGENVSRLRYLRALGGGSPEPIWMDVELGWPFTESAAQGGRRILPAEARSAVWHSIIAGARGIIYFDHNFGPGTPGSTIRREGYADARAKMKSVNAQITALAPVLNSPTVVSGWSQGDGTDTMVKWAASGKGNKKRCKSKRGKKQRKKCKKKAKGGAAASKKRKKKCGSRGKKKCRRATSKGGLYVFAGATRSPVEGRFSLPCVGNTKAAVLGENRRVAVHHGSFSDHFADANAIHIYRIRPVRRCGTARQAAAVPVDLSTGGGRETAVPQSAEVDQGKQSHDVPRVVIAAIAALVIGVLAFFGFRRLTRQTPRRSGRPGRHGHRFGMR
ncbi:MAG TPA: hypothetical protein VIZ61_15310 [Solirubrobacterales bacterium]